MPVVVFNNENATPLHYAAQNGSEELCEMLLSFHAPLETRKEYGATALHLAVIKGHAGVCRLLIRQGAVINSRLNPDLVTGVSELGLAIPLHLAALAGNKEIVALLLELGADRTATTQVGDTPQMLAEKRGHVEVAALLATYVPASSPALLDLAVLASAERDQKRVKIIL